MEPVRHETSRDGAINAIALPGAAALHGLKQLIHELEPVIGADAAERVRAKIELTVTASGLPDEVRTAFLHGLR